MITYRVAAINPEFFSSYFQMTQHSWKSSDLFEVKANLRRYISRIIWFIKTAVSFNNSLDPGSVADSDPEPEGSETFGRIRIRSGTEINVLDPDSNPK